MPLPDLSIVLKVSARLVDLHDSRRGYGESPAYQGDARAGHGDGRYIAIATQILQALHEFGRRSGDEYASLEAIVQAVQHAIPWAQAVDVEYGLSVLARPTELKFLLAEEDGAGHVITEKDTNLVEKSPNLSEFRMSRVGRLLLAMAAKLDDEYQDIAYIEGDVTKLIRALEAGKMTAALRFVDQLNEQLRSAHTSLVSLIERGGRGLRQSFGELKGHTELMRRTNDLVKTADARISEIIRTDRAVDDENASIGLVRERVHELSRGIVRYSRQLSQLSSLVSTGVSSSVEVPSFNDLARHWVQQAPGEVRLDHLMAVLGPAATIGILPSGGDFQGAIKQKPLRTQSLESMDLSEYSEPPEHDFSRWLRENRDVIERRIREGGFSLDAAIAEGLAHVRDEVTFTYLVAAMSSIESWADAQGLKLTLGEALSKVRLPHSEIMFSKLILSADPSVKNTAKDAR